MAEMLEETLAPSVELDITSMPLQDITLSQTLPLINGGNKKSFGKISSLYGTRNKDGTPIVSRTIKEYEDELEMFQRENFNLKLRIYFLEERIGISSADEDAIRRDIELKVEVETMRKELEEKQELLCQAAKAIQLLEEQKKKSSHIQDQYLKSSENARQRIDKLEKELAEHRENDLNASTYYKEAFGITPEQALQNAEKLRQVVEMVATLETEVKQLTASLGEERNWAQELESERDQLRERVDVETRLREKQDADRVQDIEELRQKVKQLEEQLIKKDSVVQQYKSDLVERDRILKEKTTLLQDKCRAYDEVSEISDKRKNQIVQLRTSLKMRDEALTDINSKHRALLTQCENNRWSPPNSPSALNSLVNPLSPSMERKMFYNQGVENSDSIYTNWKSIKEKTVTSILQSGDIAEIKRLTERLEEKNNELKRQEELRKQLILKLCNTQKQAENTDQKLKKMEGEHEKAIRAIQGFMEHEKQMQDANFRKERRIVELERELHVLKECSHMKMIRNNQDRVSPENFDVNNENETENNTSKQQRFEEMERKISELQNQIETIKAEKHILEKRIQDESEILQDRLYNKQQKIEILETENQQVKEQLTNKITELEKLKHVETQITDEVTTTHDIETLQRVDLREELNQRNAEIIEKNRKIEQLTKELKTKTQNLQKLVNTELWSKNKEIAKLHNHMTASCGYEKYRNKPETIQETSNSHLTNLIHELSKMGIKVTFIDDIIHLNYADSDNHIDLKTLAEHIQRLADQKNILEKEVDYLKWLKLISRPDIFSEIENYVSGTEQTKKYCDLLHAHLNNLVKFMKETLDTTDRTDIIRNEHKKIVLSALLTSEVFSNDFFRAIEAIYVKRDCLSSDKIDNPVRRSKSENIVDTTKNQLSTQSDSEAFSEPDRRVSLARIGLREAQHKTLSRSRFTKHVKTSSDSEDSEKCVPYYKTYQNDLNELDLSHQIQELKETNNMLYSELNDLRIDLATKTSFDCTIDEKLISFITKLEKSQRFCVKLQSTLDKKMQEFQILRKEKQNNVRKIHLEKRISDVEQMANEMTRQKAELIQYRENVEKKNSDIISSLKKENEMLRIKIRKLEEEKDSAKKSISTLNMEIDRFTLLHSQILIENTKLTNDKIKTEQEFRKMENRYDMTIRSIQDKFSKEISDLNLINDSQRAKVQELESANKEFRRHMAICEGSDSAPSSSGISSIPTDAMLKQTCDILQEYQPYDNARYWVPTNHSAIETHSKSSCSPDLGIESDAAVTSVRPLKETLKLTESMSNLLSDDDETDNNRIQSAECESPLPTEGINEVDVLKQENEALKQKLMRTRKALEDTFVHLTASNRNKKHIEQALMKRLSITKTILNRTKAFEDSVNNS